MNRLTKREGKHTVRIGNEWKRDNVPWLRLADYEDIGLSPEEVKLLKHESELFRMDRDSQEDEDALNW